MSSGMYSNSDSPLEQQLLRNWCIVGDYAHHIRGAFVCPDDVTGVGCSKVVESTYFIKDAFPGSSIVEFFKEY